MKKIIIAIMAVVAYVNNVNAQNDQLNAYKEQRLEDLPYIQAYQTDEGEILKAADCCGWGLELFAGYNLSENGNTPLAGLSGRYDGKKVSYRLSVSAMSRKFNDEAIEAGKRYYSYAAEGAFHVNLFNKGYHTNVLSLYATVGYIYGKHRFDVGEIEVEDGTIERSVKHNASGLTYGGGIEYRHQFFATGNALAIRIGCQTLPDTWNNNTKVDVMYGITGTFTWGLGRNRVRK